ncbi:MULTISPECIES: FAD-binding oxidoreductase [Cyanophyceae]|uniref:FAD-binding oxidoreductase n=1 Tax=Cyanophyceae TaxID=3028117 RepID=UPI00232DC9DF|nr:MULTISPECIES: FAD-binding oxidoreductase [Cyanophyceae]MDB9358131.1 FAD-binding oxidoreductase [Nodularia spumigena CS-587/03]MDB9306885.1 FAD-binding oxidoreductase [Nodularia spumigena CS-591/12]MDB9338666.1 FAD-binding oxidoreductase [Nodularia spumigena CS-589/07]MDB9398866.1 FAD-binding oxidoreductase [Microcystis aeruginosa CS-567/02-A1]MDB9497715.1 FAD-binding oxidoreductase [Nodularia spumigena CS-336/02]
MATALETLINSLEGIEIITQTTQVAKLSQDYHTFSPVLVPKLQGKVGDIVVRPANEDEVIKVASACVQCKIPVTVRGAGTGNYGQCVPLHGGVILDMSKMQGIPWVKPGVARVEAGVKLAAIDKKARDIGWEIRMAPSTYRTATIGGFIAGGSGGIGSIQYGLLGDRGNILALRVVTLEDEPRVIELRGDDVHKVTHAWGINGIITEAEIPLGPAYPWAEVIVTFDDFMAAAKFGQALGNADGMIKKLIAVFASPIPQYFHPLQEYIPEGTHSVLLMLAEPSLELLPGLVQQYGGQITYQKPVAEKSINLGEFTWNHTTLHAGTVDTSITYLQSMFPADASLELIEHMYHYFGDEVMMHLEFFRVNGRVIPGALQLVRYSTEERLNEIIRYHEAKGVSIANPHTYIIEDGGRKVIDPEQLKFKAMVDPYGLMNPGKSKVLEFEIPN